MNIEALSLADTYKKLKTQITSDDLIVHCVNLLLHKKVYANPNKENDFKISQDELFAQIDETVHQYNTYKDSGIQPISVSKNTAEEIAKIYEKVTNQFIASFWGVGVIHPNPENNNIGCFFFNFPDAPEHIPTRKNPFQITAISPREIFDKVENSNAVSLTDCIILTINHLIEQRVKHIPLNITQFIIYHDEFFNELQKNANKHKYELNVSKIFNVSRFLDGFQTLSNIYTQVKDIYESKGWFIDVFFPSFDEINNLGYWRFNFHEEKDFNQY